MNPFIDVEEVKALRRILDDLNNNLITTSQTIPGI
jgi:hypothetical protein